jgi:hypothetical protein
MEAIQDPVAVINTLQARIHQLEAQLRLEREQAQESIQRFLPDALRRLRMHAVIPLYVGSADGEALREDIAKSSPELSQAMKEVWMLSGAPVTHDVKSAIAAAAKNGMSRWF